MMRVPPNALDAERAVLCGIMLEAPAFDVVRDVLRDRDDFYGEANAVVFDAAVALASKSQPIDHTTLRDELARSGKLAAIGGDEYLFALAASLPIVENIAAHASIVREKAAVRALITACHEISAAGYGDYGDLDTLSNDVESRILGALGSQKRSGGPVVVDCIDMMREITDAHEGKVNPNGHPTGIKALDDFTTGAHPGDVIVIAGRPGMGKSALGMGALFAAAEHTGLPAPYFSLEMQTRKCRRRLLSMLSGVDGHSIKKGRLRNESWPLLAHASQRISDSKFMIDAQSNITMPEIRSRSRRLAAKHGGLAGIVVDYIQLMEGASDERSREREIAKISRGLKTLAMEINCPVYVLSQLNRACEERPDKRPQVSDLRESGAIEQDADAIWLLYRRGYYAAQMAKEEANGNAAPVSKFKPRCIIQPGEDDGKGEIIVGKQRDGSPGVVRVRFEGPCTRYIDNDFVQPRAPSFQYGVPDPVGGDSEDSGDGEPFQENWYP